MKFFKSQTFAPRIQCLFALLVRGRVLQTTLKNEERKEMKNLGWADVAGIAVVWIMAVVIVLLVKESSVAIAAISVIFAANLSDRIITRGDTESEN